MLGTTMNRYKDSGWADADSLFTQLGILEETLRVDRRLSPLWLRVQLASLKRRLGEQFYTQEQSARTRRVLNPQAALKQAPQRGSYEHRQLLEAADTLLEELEAVQTLDAALREKTLRWMLQVRQQERSLADQADEDPQAWLRDALPQN
jgi:hypothetical protein